jgi:hypothetical protein
MMNLSSVFWVVKWLGLPLFAWALSLSLGRAECRALLVGVDVYAEGIAPLKGCVKDTERFERVLVNTLKVDGGGIRRLANPSKAEVVRVFREHLIASAAGGDAIIFFFSGHGTQWPDLDGDEAQDKLDEALLFKDTKAANRATFLLDDELGQLLDEVPSANILVVIDSCHSGSGTRSPYATYAGTRGITVVYDPSPERSRPGAFGAGLGTKKPVSVFAAAQAAQKAYELPAAELGALGFPADAPGGLLTAALCEAMVQKPDLPFGELARTVTQRVEDAVPELRKQNLGPGRISQTPHFQLAAAGMSMPGFVAAKVPVPTPIAPSVPVVQPVGPDNPSMEQDGSIRRGEIKVALTLNERKFKAGDKLVATVTSDRDGFLGLFYLNAHGKVEQIFPNDEKQDSAIIAGKPIVVPGDTHDFDFIMGAPFGAETLKAVVATERFFKLEFDDANELIWGSARDEVTKGIAVQRRKEAATESPDGFRFGEASITYDIWEAGEP